MKSEFQNFGGGHRLLQFAYGAPRRPQYLFNEGDFSELSEWAWLVTICLRGAQNNYSMKPNFQSVGSGHRLLQFADGAPRSPK